MGQCDVVRRLDAGHDEGAVLVGQDCGLAEDLDTSSSDWRPSAKLAKPRMPSSTQVVQESSPQPAASVMMRVPTVPTVAMVLRVPIAFMRAVPAINL